MRKDPNKKATKRAWGIADANRVEWELIIENPDLITEVNNIQKTHNLPIERDKLKDWQGWDEVEFDTDDGTIIFGERWKRHIEFEKGLDRLIDKFDIPSKWKSSLRNMALLGTKSPDTLGMGFPNIRHDENHKLQVIITDETDTDNPLVQELIKHVRKINIDPPPQPEKIKNSRKLDWRPLWIWHNKHHDTTFEEIGKLLRRHPSNIRREMANLDNNDGRIN